MHLRRLVTGAGGIWLASTLLLSVSAKTTIELVCNDPPALRAGAYERAIKAFELANPTIKVKYTLFPGDFIPYLLTRAAGGAMPDVFYNRGAFTNMMASNGLLLNLDSYIKRDKLDMSDLWASQIGEMKWNGSFYELPENLSSWAVSYNVDIAREAGVVIPTTPWTWDDLRLAATKLTKRDGNKTSRYGFQYNIWGPWAMFGMFYGASGQIYAPDMKSCTIANPENAKLLAMFSEMADQGIIPPGASGDFPGKKVAMSFDGSWVTDMWRLQLKTHHFDVAYAPTGEFSKRPSSGNAGAGYAIARSTKKAEAAWKFVKFLTSEDTLDDLVVGKLVNIPARKSTAERFVKKVLATGDPKNVRIWLDSAEKGWSIPSTPFYDDTQKSIGAAMQKLWAKKRSPDTALADIASEVNAAIRRKTKK